MRRERPGSSFEWVRDDAKEHKHQNTTMQVQGTASKAVWLSASIKRIPQGNRSKETEDANH